MAVSQMLAYRQYFPLWVLIGVECGLAVNALYGNLIMIFIVVLITLCCAVQYAGITLVLV